MRRASASAVMLLLALHARLLWADGAPPPRAPAAQEPAPGARLHFEQGVALYNDGNYSAALAEFTASHRDNALPAVLYNIGLTQKALFRYTDAIDTLTRYLAEAQPKPERRAEVERVVAEMQALLAPVTLQVNPPGAAVVIDGRAAGAAPLTVQRLAAGGHVIEVSAEGHRPLRREIMVSAGQPLELRLLLPALPRTGKVRLRSTVSAAQVTLDGRPVGQVPLELDLRAGGYLLVVSAPERLPYRGELVVTAGQQRDLMIALDPVRRERIYHKWWFWTLGALVAGGVATAVTLPLTQRTQAPLSGTLDPFVVKAN